MFDFMKDLYLTINDFDMQQIKEEKEIKKHQEKAERVFLSKNLKRNLFLGVSLFFFITMFSLIFYINKNSIVGIVKESILMLMDIGILVCLLIKKKKTEIISLIGVFLIIIITFVILP